MKIRAYLGIGYVGANHEEVLDIDDSEVKGLNEEEKEEFINEVVQDWANNYIEVNWNIE